MRYGNVREATDELMLSWPGPPCVIHTWQVCLHVCLQLQVSPGCALIRLLGNMFPQAQVELFITPASQTQQQHFLITTLLLDLIKVKTGRRALHSK